MPRIYAVLAVLIVALAGALYGLYSTSKALTLTEGRVDELAGRLEAAEARIGRVQTQATTATKKAQEARNALDQVLDRHREDASAPVPPAIADSLCSTLRCPGKPR